MTDAEVICEFMEPKPKFSTDQGDMSCDLWWWMGTKAWEPTEPTLDALHEVEEMLTDEQWWRYEAVLVGAVDDGPRPVLWIVKAQIHATAEQKIKALAAVLRA